MVQNDSAAAALWTSYERIRLSEPLQKTGSGGPRAKECATETLSLISVQLMCDIYSSFIITCNTYDNAFKIVESASPYVI